MSETMFKIAICILAWDIVILFLLYIRTPPTFLPRLPINIASILAYVAASHAMAEIATDETETGTEKRHRSQWEIPRYGFGRFVGTDGKTHIGIERAPFVMPLRTGTGSSSLRLGLRRRDTNPQSV